MNFYSYWPYFIGMAALLAIAATPLFRAADTPPSLHPNRLVALDGLRGFLALAIFYCHAALYHEFLRVGRWQLPPSRFYTPLGQASIAMFFMITGFLFWSRMIRAHGRPNWVRFYIDRIFRLGPLYLFAVAVMLGIVFARTGFTLNVPLLELVTQIGRWLMLGFLSGHNINGYPETSHVIAGVTWTLRFEWWFYLSLPLTALAARSSGTHLAFAIACLAASLIYTDLHPLSSAIAPAQVCAIFFFTGMACASLKAADLALKIPDWFASFGVLFLLACVFICFDTAYKAYPAILVGLVFYLIISGCTLFGLLDCLPARRLGNISYGIYLLQGLILTCVFSFTPLQQFALSSPLQHWTIMFACAVLLIVVATFAHVLIERPGIVWGRQFLKMKIALIDSSLFGWPYDNALAVALRENGHEAQVYSKYLGQGEAAQYPPHYQETFYPGFEHAWMQGLPKPLFLAFKGIAHSIGLMKLWRALHRWRPHVIHFQWTPLPVMDWFFIPAFRRIAPVILTAHDSMPFNNNPRSRLQRLGAIAIMRRFDRLIVHTEQAVRRLVAHGLPLSHIARIPHGLLEADMVYSPPKTDGPVTLLLFGKLKPYKGADILIRALALMPPEVSARARVHIVGKPYMDVEPLYALAKTLKIESSIEWDLRFVDDVEIADIFARSDVMVMPYREIDASGVLMQALGAGRPIVASKIGLFAEMLEDGRHGYLVAPEDAQALATALVRLVENDKARLQMGEAVRALKVSIPSWREIAGMTEAIYRQVLYPQAKQT